MMRLILPAPRARPVPRLPFCGRSGIPRRSNGGHYIRLQ